MRSQLKKYGGFWGVLDHWSHNSWLVPAWLQWRICHRYDKALGLFDDEAE